MKFAVVSFIVAAGAIVGYFFGPASSVSTSPSSVVTAPTSPSEPLSATSPQSPASSPALPVTAKKVREPDTPLDQVYDLLKEGRKEAAVTALKAILKENPNHEMALLELAMLFTRNPKTQAAALATLEKVLTINPNNDTAVGELLQLSREDAAAGPGKSIGELLAKLSEKYPDSANINAGLGFWFLTRQRYDEAKHFLERGTKDPDYAEAAYNSLTRLYLETGNQPQLIATFRAWIAEQTKAIDRLKAANEDYHLLQYQNLITRVRLADTLRQSGNRQAAEQIVRDVLAAAPHQPDALALLKQL